MGIVRGGEDHLMSPTIPPANGRRLRSGSCALHGTIQAFQQPHLDMPTASFFDLLPSFQPHEEIPAHRASHASDDGMPKSIDKQWELLEADKPWYFKSMY